MFFLCENCKNLLAVGGSALPLCQILGAPLNRGSSDKEKITNEMEGRCESDCGGDEVHPATFANEEQTGLKLDRRRNFNVNARKR